MQNNTDLTLTIKRKTAVFKNLRLKVTGYSQVEYYDTLSNRDMIIFCKNYVISQEIDIVA